MFFVFFLNLGSSLGFEHTDHRVLRTPKGVHVLIGITLDEAQTRASEWAGLLSPESIHTRDQKRERFLPMGRASRVGVSPLGVITQPLRSPWANSTY